ncbi:MAG: Phosphoribosylamine--glycine ligase [uncultured Thermomicrobiales bacterium]|uniref:Phosphoribosylamine--glycine ligase n=1 Tax=uncultured Thermomicrobiales bacterium TaxID=1645740 RepID=A0A6J4TYD5_9BACT|nr:MAG: Phosphoribosylamine--glycine ligase [uncultured Thermomicrobiales bacterium]
MRILVVGGGGREHALLWKLAQSSRVGALLCAPGNPGTAELAETVPVPGSDLDGIAGAALERNADLVVIGPEAPLIAGLADRLAAAGVAVCGPTAAAARIEGSKAWAKEIMAEAGVPTARAVVVRDLVAGLTALGGFDPPVVVKADGLAAGKGVVVAATRVEAAMALTALLEDDALGPAGRTVVLEEFLEGREVSVLALTDGETIVPLPPARDHKRVFDRDRGPNTGGMGAFAPPPDLPEGFLATVHDTILAPTVRALAARGTPFRGVLYAGLMLTADGPVCLEFNARFGDPETQVILPLLDAGTDLAELLAAVAAGTLRDAPVPPPARETSVGVVLAAGGYPGPYRTGLPIAGLERVPEDILVFHAGTRRDPDGGVVTTGGRVLTVVGRGPDLAAARERAYAGADAIGFEGKHLRRDIGG